MRTIRRRRRNPATASFKVAIITTFHGPTNFSGSRITASAGRGRTITVPYQHEKNVDQAHAYAAEALCKKMGWTGNLIGGGMEKGMAWVFTS